MSSTTPTPQTWTLRFKHHRTTVLLHIDPQQELSSLKSNLLTALQQTHPSNILNNQTIPSNASDILLAKPRDINNLAAGWVSLEPATNDWGEEGDSGKGKGKGKVVVSEKQKEIGGGKGGLKDFGLRDGGVVAFKFRRREDKEGWQKVDEDEDGDAFIQVEEEEEEEEEEWDVVVPNVEEIYGEGGGG